MKMFLVVMFWAAVAAPCFGGEIPDDEAILPVEPVENITTIMCPHRRDVYVNGERQGPEREDNMIQCSTRNEVKPSCQTKVEERSENNITTTIVWKRCSTIRACNRNARENNPNWCAPTDDEGNDRVVRVCFSCCEDDNCNESASSIEYAEGYVGKPKMEGDTN